MTVTRSSTLNPYGERALDQLIAAAGAEPDELKLFALLDGARSKLLVPELLATKTPHTCLYDGELPPALALCAPYLAELRDGQGAFAEWLLKEGWGDSQAVFLVSKAKRGALRKHFRRFLRVRRAGKDLYFRYYDPRVLRIYLPTCNAEELEFVFGPAQAFLCEAEDAQTLLRFSLADGELRAEEVALSEPAVEAATKETP